MGAIQIPALGLATLIGIGVVVLILALFFGATCLHLTTRFLKFKKRRFRTALGANLLVVFAPALGSGGANLLATYAETAEPAWPFIVGSVLLGLLGGLFPVLIIQHMYRQTFTRSLMAYVLSIVLEVAFAIATFLALCAVVIAFGQATTPPAG
jgi:hypothetical protein